MKVGAIGGVWNDDTGVSAVEFALLAPPFVMVLFGLVNIGVLMYAQASLHDAVEEGARCASVKTTVCTDAASTEAYTRNHYHGPSISPTFTVASQACGNSVTASATYVLNAVLFEASVPLSAAACFP
jgi:Flp pilus assembly protein TadG